MTIFLYIGIDQKSGSRKHTHHGLSVSNSGTNVSNKMLLNAVTVSELLRKNQQGYNCPPHSD